MVTTAPPVHFINVSYFFAALYNLFFGGGLPRISDLANLAGALWFWLSMAAYLFTLVCIGVLVYKTIRLHQFEEELEAQFVTIPEEEAHEQVEHARWKRVKELIESPHESDWRSAIIEADIMLEEMLRQRGYEGAGVGDMLKSANAAHFHTLQDAWEAHKVRNDIAHQGSGFQLTDHLAYRTIGHYENVFREFNEI